MNGFYERTLNILNKDKSRLPIGFMHCLTADISQVLKGYMDISSYDINIDLEYIEDGRHEIRIKAVGMVKRVSLPQQKGVKKACNFKE